MATERFSRIRSQPVNAPSPSSRRDETPEAGSKIPAAAAATLHLGEEPTDLELAAALLELDGAPAPSRPETARLLAILVRAAFRAMPGASIPWDRAQYLNAASYPLHVLDDDLTLAIASTELGLLRTRPNHSYEWWTPANALEDNLEEKAHQLLSLLAKRLIDTGAVPDWPGARRESGTEKEK